MRMVRFILRRLALMVFTLFVLSVVIFYTSSFFSPIQRAMLFISPQAYSHPGRDAFSQLDEIARKYHLYDPVHVQYINWLRVALTERTLGYTFSYGDWVSDAIRDRFPATIELVMYSAPLIIIGGIKFGTYSALRANEKKKRQGASDFAARALTAWGHSIPTFFIGLLLLSVFALTLGWVGPGRASTDSLLFMFASKSWGDYTGLYTIDALLNGQFWIFLDALKHLVLPVITLTLCMLPVIARITRSSIISELNKHYILAAKAKGLSKAEVTKHARKNATISILTISSTILASMLTGIVVTESVFDLDGVGSLAKNAAARLDFPLMVGLAIVFCLIFLIIGLIVDIVYTYVDPRVEL